MTNNKAFDKHMPAPDIISSFSIRYAFLSNFYPSPFTLLFESGILQWATVEHAYQATKTRNSDEQKKIRAAVSPGQAKRLGRQVELREDWDSIKLGVMFRLVEAKFRQNPELAELLLATGDALLFEGNNWHDTYWGVCKCNRCLGQGQNKLGIILANIRGRLYEKRQA